MRAATAFGGGLFLAMVSTAVLAPQAQAATVTKFSLHDQSMMAFFEAADSCFIATSSVRYAASVTQTEGPPVVTPPAVFVEVDYQNFCTGDAFFLSGGGAPTSAHIDGDVDAATLTAVVPVTDGNITVDVTVNLTFTGNGDLQLVDQKFKTNDGNIKVKETIKLMQRSAAVTGTVHATLPFSTGSANFEFAQTNESGSLGRDAVGERTVTKN